MRNLMILVLMLSLAGCQDERESTKTKEAEMREKAVIRQSEERQARMRTLRVLGFVILSSGAVFALVWLGRPVSSVDRSTGSQMRLPETNWRDIHPKPAQSRIIDISSQPSVAKTRQTRRRS